jgi:hypothetical protein
VQLRESVTLAGTKVQELLVGIDLDSLLANSRPDQTVSLLSASGDLKAVGADPVNGMSAQHLSGAVDLAKAMTALGATSPAYRSIQQMVTSAGVKHTHIDLWVNDQDIPIKFVETYTSKLGAGPAR